MPLLGSFFVTAPFSPKDTFLRLHHTGVGGLHPACCTNAKWIGITVLKLLQFLDHPVLVKLNPPKSDRSYVSLKFDVWKTEIYFSYLLSFEIRNATGWKLSCW